MCARAASMALVAAWVVTWASSPRNTGSAPRRRPARRSGPSSTASVSSHRAAQVGLQVVGVGVEIGEAGRELPPSRRHGRSPVHGCGQRTVTGVHRRLGRHRRARRSQHHADHERTDPRGSTPAAPDPSGRPRWCAGRAVDVHPGETWQCPCRAGQPAEPAAAEHTPPVFHGFATAADAKGVPADDRGHVAVLARPGPRFSGCSTGFRREGRAGRGHREPAPVRLPRAAHAPRSAAPCR